MRKTNILNRYLDQMAKSHAIKIDEGVKLVINRKPWWMPRWVYKSVIKELVSITYKLPNL